LLTVLGELVLPSGQPVWTSALLHVLRGVGVEEQTARQAIARGAAAGWIEGSRRGREVRWEITPAGRLLIEEGTRRVYSLSAGTPAWDGRWLILLITIPHEQRAVRKKLYGALSWAGFGNPATSVWLTPHPERVAEAERVVGRGPDRCRDRRTRLGPRRARRDVRRVAAHPHRSAAGAR
jgi:phenylacetic acid degradation operon negative regulatory protein